MQFNIIFKTLFEYIHTKFRFMHTNTFCKYRKKNLLASPRVHLVVIYFALKMFKNIDFYIKRDAREAYPYFLPEQECNLVTVLV